MTTMPIEMKVLANHIYEYHKGVRQMILYTFNRRYVDYAVSKLENLDINYLLQPAGENTMNLFFGRKECLDAIRFLVDKPLSKLSPEEDFILGTLLGYDLRMQCERFCQRKDKVCRCAGC